MSPRTRSVVVASVAIIVLIAVAMLLLPAYGRYQSRADAHNRVRINNTRIQYYQQQEGIERKKAEIRVIHAIGIRKAQDHIATTLTPLYVQWEAIQAELAMANSRNNSMVYIPVGANGVPLVSVTGQPQVLGGNTGK